MFIELDETNAGHLRKEIEKLGNLPSNVGYNIYAEDAFGLLSKVADEFQKSGTRLAPCFMFVDPYGFSIPCEVLRRIKKHSRSELLITFIWRELDMAMRQENAPRGLREKIDAVFGGEDWNNIVAIDEFDARGEAAVQLLKRRIGARWATCIRMLGDNQKTRYFLLHLTDHEAGRDLMKEVVWKCCPGVGYYVRKRDNPKQQYLIKPEPDLKELRDWLLNKLRRRRWTWQELVESLRCEIWLNKHLWQVIRELKNKGEIIPADLSGKFSQKANPTFRLGTAER